MLSDGPIYLHWIRIDGLCRCAGDGHGAGPGGRDCDQQNHAVRTGGLVRDERCEMNEAVLAAYRLSEADLLGSGWESTIYALGPTKILRLPRPEAGVERQVRARAAFTASLPPLPFAVPQVRKISTVAGQLVVIEDRIEGQAMEAMLPGLSGARRREALAAYLTAAEAMAVVTATGEPYGDLLTEQPIRTARWADYLVARIRVAVEDEVLAADVPGLAIIAAQLIARLESMPDPERCVVHGDIWPPNIMMNDALQVTGLIDFSFTTRVGDHLMDLAGAAHFLRIGNPHASEDYAYLMQLIAERHGAEVVERVGLYAVWFAFSFAYNHEDTVIYPWCVDLIRSFAA